MSDPIAPVPDTPERRSPALTWFWPAVCWGAGSVFLDEWVECRALVGLSAPETASLVGALGSAGMLALMLVFADGPVVRPSTSPSGVRTEQASSSIGKLLRSIVLASRRRHRAFLFAWLILLLLLSWHNSLREYGTALSRIASGECAVQGQG